MKKLDRRGTGKSLGLGQFGLFMLAQKMVKKIICCNFALHYI
jgi:hypothetical protein